MSIVPFHMLMGIAIRTAHRKKEITDEQFMQMKQAIRDPHKCAALEEAAYQHSVKMGEINGGVPMESVNWGSLFDWLMKILPILLQILPLILAEGPPAE